MEVSHALEPNRHPPSHEIRAIYIVREYEALERCQFLIKSEVRELVASHLELKLEQGELAKKVRRSDSRIDAFVHDFDTLASKFNPKKVAFDDLSDDERNLFARITSIKQKFKRHRSEEEQYSVADSDQAEIAADLIRIGDGATILQLAYDQFDLTINGAAVERLHSCFEKLLGYQEADPNNAQIKVNFENVWRLFACARHVQGDLMRKAIEILSAKFAQSNSLSFEQEMALAKESKIEALRSRYPSRASFLEESAKNFEVLIDGYRGCQQALSKGQITGPIAKLLFSDDDVKLMTCMEKLKLHALERLLDEAYSTY